MKTSKKEFNKKLILLVCSAAYFLIVLMATSFISRAETITPLPYYVNAYFGDNFRLTQQQMSVLTPYISDTTYTFYWLGEPYEWNNNYFACQLCGYNINSSGQTVALRSSDLNYDVDYGMFDIMSDYVVLSTNSGTFVKAVVLISKTSGDFSIASVTLPRVRSSALLGLGNKTINQYGYTPNVPITFNSESPFLWQGNSEQIIFTNGTPVPPSPEDDNITDDTVKPSWSDYVVDWVTGKPTFDTDHPFDSLFNIMSWSFGKLADTFTNGFNFLVDSLNWSLQTFLNNVRAKFELVIEAVNDIGDLIEDFIQSVNGFLSDIQEKLSDFFDGFVEFADLFIHPFDEEEFEEQIDNCQLITQYNDLLDNCDIIREVFATAQEKDSFILYIDFENPFADSEHKIITSEINFNWLVPLRSVYRPFLWVFALLDCFIGGCQLLGNIIGGKAK